MGSKIKSPTDISFLVAFSVAITVAIVPASPLRNSEKLLSNVVQLVTHYSLNAAKSVDPAARPALMLMLLFCGWLVGSMVFWDDVKQTVATSGDQQELLNLCEQLADAEVAYDEDAIKRVTHRNFQFTDTDGKTMGRSDFISLTRQLNTQSQQLVATPARIEGSRAFLQGTTAIISRSVGDERLIYEFVMTFVQVQGKWKIVAQRLALSQPDKSEDIPDKIAA